MKVLSRNPAVHLFVDRAQITKGDFTLNERNAAALVAICHRLEGLPLAIELATARLRILSPDEIVERLQKRLKLLVGTALHLPQRQQTMRNTIMNSASLPDVRRLSMDGQFQRQKRFVPMMVRAKYPMH